MIPRRDTLRTGPHWHVDCRLEGELPKNDAVSSQFLTNLLFGSVTLSLLLFSSWLAYKTYNVRRQLSETENRIQTSMSEVRVIQAMQREYVAEASKVDQAYATIRPTLFVSEFLRVLSRTLPPEITVESLDWNDTDVLLRGTVRESREQAVRTLGRYVDTVKTDASIGAWFSAVRTTAYDPVKGTFSVTFRLQPLPPL